MTSKDGEETENGGECHQANTPTVPADLNRLIVVTPNDGSSYLERVYASAGLPFPPALAGFEDEVNDWCAEYKDEFADTRVLEVLLDNAVYCFDQSPRYERVVVAYGISSTTGAKRDTGRMRRFPDVNVGIRAHLGSNAFSADRGHFLSHASGGELDINLFPHRSELNRGWSDEGKIFRKMEQHAASRPGVFHFHRAFYDDDTWIPSRLQYGVLQDDRNWWIETFANK